MTEAEWLSCGRIDDLLESHFCNSPRKLRLLACACARRVLQFLDGDVFEDAVRMSEAFADGVTGLSQLETMQRAVAQAQAKLAVGPRNSHAEFAAAAVFYLCGPILRCFFRTST